MKHSHWFTCTTIHCKALISSQPVYFFFPTWFWFEMGGCDLVPAPTLTSLDVILICVPHKPRFMTKEFPESDGIGPHFHHNYGAWRDERGHAVWTHRMSPNVDMAAVDLSSNLLTCTSIHIDPCFSMFSQGVNSLPWISHSCSKLWAQHVILELSSPLMPQIQVSTSYEITSNSDGIWSHRQIQSFIRIATIRRWLHDPEHPQSSVT